MKIGIEATSAVEAQKAGVGYYIYNLIRALIRLQTECHTYTLYFRHPTPDLSTRFHTEETHLPHVIARVLRFPYLWAQIRLPVELWSHPQNVYFFPSSVLPLWYQPENSVITIHDIAFLFFRDCFSPMLWRWLTVATEQGIRKARKIIAVSEATRQDILAYYEVAPEKVVTIHHGVHERFTPADRNAIEAVKKKYQIDGAYILCVGTLQRRKNVPRLLHAFYLLKQKHTLPHKLVLVGQKYSNLPEDEIFSTIERLFLQEEIVWTGYVAEQDIPALLSGAEVFVFPSLYEGFGMPVIEAMACGVPVACSNTSSLPEVAGESGLMFDPYSVENITETLRRLLTDQELRMELRQKGLDWAAQFSWDTCARNTLNVFESVGNAG